jgi:ribonuclease HII
MQLHDLAVAIEQRSHQTDFALDMAEIGFAAAKVARDDYIEKLCDQHPVLDEMYSLRGNKGYGAKKHLDGIREHGITQWHRRSYGICKEFA